MIFFFLSQLVKKATLTVYPMRSWMLFNISSHQSRKFVADLILRLQMQVFVCLGCMEMGCDSLIFLVALRVSQHVYWKGLAKPLKHANT